MRLLNSHECQKVTGTEGRFKVIIKTQVPKDCADFLIDLWERILMKELTLAQANQYVFSSSFKTTDLQTAFEGMEIVYFK